MTNRVFIIEWDTVKEEDSLGKKSAGISCLRMLNSLGVPLLFSNESEENNSC